MPTRKVCEIRIQGQPLFRAFGLHSFHSAVDPRPLNFDSQAFPVEVFPTQTKQFTCSKPERRVYSCLEIVVFRVGEDVVESQGPGFDVSEFMLSSITEFAFSNRVIDRTRVQVIDKASPSVSLGADMTQGKEFFDEASVTFAAGSGTAPPRGKTEGAAPNRSRSDEGRGEGGLRAARRPYAASASDATRARATLFWALVCGGGF